MFRCCGCGAWSRRLRRVQQPQLADAKVVAASPASQQRHIQQHGAGARRRRSVGRMRRGRRRRSQRLLQWKDDADGRRRQPALPTPAGASDDGVGASGGAWPDLSGVAGAERRPRSGATDALSNPAQPAERRGRRAE